MKNYLLPLALLVFTGTSVRAQDDALGITLQHLRDNLQTYQLTDADLDDIAVSSRYEDANGVTNLYLVQRHEGVEVHNGVLNAHVRAGEVVHVGNRFVSKLDGRVNTTQPAVAPDAAVEAAAQDLDLPITEPVTVISSEGGPAREVTLSTGGISLEPIPARLVFEPLEDGGVRLAWQLQIYQLDQEHYWMVRVDAVTGSVLAKDDLVVKDDFGFENTVTDHPDWRESAAMRAFLADRYRTDLNTTARPSATAPTSDGLYEVYALPDESPSHAGEPDLLGIAQQRTRVAEAETSNPEASPLGWHDDGDFTYTTTRGNNVFAYLDSVGTEIGPSPDDLQSRNFTTDNSSLLVDYGVDYGRQPGAYGHAATVNLFYMNNMMHDIFYEYGFTEAAGNLQWSNLGRGGEENDPVLAQAQDGGGTNNANQLTAFDGVPARMQMYLWSPGVLEELLFVDSPDHLARGYLAREAAFGEPLDQEGVTANLVLAQATAGHIGAPEEGCGRTASLPAGSAPQPFANAAEIAGNIALVKRGNCTFLDKAANAQASGAIGMVVYNNVPGEPVAMGATGGEIIVMPAIMISLADGSTLRSELDAGRTVHGTMRRDGGRLPFRDGDFDNGIIAHEYGHSVSTRLVGGPGSACLGGMEQGGEGWSDWAALMLTMLSSQNRDTPRGIGTYALFEDPETGGGIRPAPYTTNMAVNDYTYGDIFNPEITVPHGVGFIWATALWEVVWNLVDEYGFDPDLYNGTGGNNLTLRLITEGMKYTPCSPTFIDMRDGILAADRVLNPLNAPDDLRQSVNECHIWEGMAKRGIGADASSGGVEDFSVPVNCDPRLTLEKEVDKPLAVAGDTITFSLTVSNHTLGSASGVVVTDPVPANTRLVSGSVSTGAGCNGAVEGGTVTFQVGTLSANGGTRTCSYSVNLDGSLHTTTLFSDDMEGGSENWETDDAPPTWIYEPISPNAHSGLAAWFAHDFATDANQHLTLTDPIHLPSAATGRTGTPGLLFWHDYETEASFDGGFVEISVNGGSWQDLGRHMTENGYNGGFFNGSSGGYLRTRVDLTDYAGNDVRVRFRMFSDLLVPGVGWYVDDVSFIDQGCVFSTATATSAELPKVVEAEAQACVTNTEPLVVSVDTRIVLEGAYDGDFGLMRTALNASGYVPASQPYADPLYDGTPMDYGGDEQVSGDFFAGHADIVDWVLVELRSSPDPENLASRAVAFVRRDGQIVGLDGSSLPSLSVPAVGPYHIVVRHRNHLPAMSASAVPPDGGVLSHDFTADGASAFGTDATKPLGPAGTAPFVLYAGDADGDGEVHQADVSGQWSKQVGTSGYRSADFNLDGEVQVSDKNDVWRPNRHQASQLDGRTPQ